MENNCRKHILLVSHFFPPNYNAGTENYTLGLAKALQSKGYAVQVVCAEDWEAGSRYWNGLTTDKFEGLTVHRHHFDWRRAGDPNKILYDSPQIEKWFDQFLVSNRFDIVHVIHTSSLGVGILRSIKRASIPLVLSLMDFWFLCPSIQLLRNDGTLCNGTTTAWQCQSCLLAQWRSFQKLNKIPVPESIKAQFWNSLARTPVISRQPGLRGRLLNVNHRKRVLAESLLLPDVVLSHSNTVRELFAQNNIKSVKVIRNGHDLSWLTLHKKIDSLKIRFGYLGQITEIKGVHILVEAYIKSMFGEKAQLDIWGDYTKDKDYTEELRTLIGDSPSIFLHGRYERVDLATILSNIDILIVPSLWYENAPLVIQEALAAKTPVITSDIGGMAEAVIHEENGLLFKHGDSEDLSRQLRRIVEEPELVDRFWQQIEPVRKFEDELVDLEYLYNDLINKYSQENS